MTKLDFIKKLYNGKNCYSDHMTEDELKLLHITSNVEELICQMMKKGKIIFLTGNPGDGKTFIIKAVNSTIEATDAYVQRDMNSTNGYLSTANDIVDCYNEQRPAIIAINEYPFIKLCQALKKISPEIIEEIDAAKKSAITYDISAPLTGRIALIDLNERNILDSDRNLLSELIVKFIKLLSEDTEHNAALEYNIKALSIPEIKAQIIALMSLAAAECEHYAIRDVLGAFAYIFTACLSEEHEGERYYSAIFSSSNELLQSVQQFDPIYLSSPTLDEALWNGEITDGWILEPPTKWPNDTDYDDNNPLFLDYMEKWTKGKSRGAQFKTNESRFSMLHGRMKRFFEPKRTRLKDLKPMDIEDFYDTMMEDDLTGNTLIHYHQYINQALKDAVKKDLLEKNPMDKVDRPKKNRPKNDYLNEEEIEQLLTAVKDDEVMYPILFVECHYGFRRSELIGLKWDAIDFNADTISIKSKVFENSQSGDKHGYEITEDLKTEQSRRTLPLIPAVKEVLLDYKKKQAAYQSLFGKSYCRDYLDMVFVDQKGMLIKPARVTERFYSIIRKNNLKKVRFHDLRHSVASLLVAKGVDMKRIQHWLGHANYSTTADIYSHVSTGIHEETASVVASALDGTAKKSMKGDDEI